MDLRLLLRQIAVKHGTEDRASHGQHILGGEREREGGREEQTDASDTTRITLKFNKGAGVALFQ